MKTSNPRHTEAEIDFVIKLFISHAWDRTDLYDELVDVLNTLPAFRWQNLSIPHETAFTIATGVDGSPQRRQLLVNRLDDIEQRSKQIDASLVRQKKRLGELRYEEQELAKYFQIDRLMTEARDAILDPGFTEKIRSLEKLQAKYDPDAATIAQRNNRENIQYLKESIAKLDSEGQQLISEAEWCTNSLNNLQSLKLGITGKQMDNVIAKFPNLALAIHNRIAAADAVIVIVLPNSAYLQWIEFEYQQAFVLRKPTIGVLHPQVAKSLPPDLRRYAIRPIEWCPDSIRTALNDRMNSVPE